MEGRRSDGVIISFNENDMDKVLPQEFTEIVITEVMTYDELKSITN